MASSRSAVAVMTMAFLPLVSACSASRGRQRQNIRAVSHEPVRTTASTSGWVISRRLASPSTHGRNCSTVRGTPPSHRTSASSPAVATVSGAGLKITALPAASAPSKPPAGIDRGKFHGEATTTVPWGRKPVPGAGMCAA